MAFKIACLLLALAAVSYGYPYYVPTYQDHILTQGYPVSNGIYVNPAGFQAPIGLNPSGIPMYPGVPTEFRNFGGIQNGFRGFGIPEGFNVGGFGPVGFNQGALGPASPGFGYGSTVQGPVSNGVEQHGIARFPGLGGQGGYKQHGY